MSETRSVTLTSRFEEDASFTDAVVTMRLRDLEFTGHGTARRNPDDPSVPMIGEELALARALNDLSHRLLAEAASAIEAFEGHPVSLDA